MRDIKWLKAPWTISIGTLLLTILYDYFKSKPILSTIWQLLKIIGNFIVSFLNFNLKVWWLIIIFIFVIIIIYLINKFQPKEDIKPDFYNYREDNFQGFRWTWKWDFNPYKGGWVISDLNAHCPKCDTRLIDFSECPRCDFIIFDKLESYKIQHIILDNIERNKIN